MDFLAQSVESILAQTFRDFEWLVIDDGSTDGSGEFLAHVADTRLRLWRNEKNIGLTRSLRWGVEMAQGQYLARMDADDVAHPERLARQVAFLDEHAGVGIVGTACRIIDERGRSRGEYPVPISDAHIRWTSLLANPFAHPTVMLRREMLMRHGLNYDKTYETTQDYELWTRMLRHTQGANLSAQLIQYRQRPGITYTRREAQLQNHDAIALRTIRELLPDFAITSEQISDLRTLLVGGREARPSVETRRGALANLYLDMLQAFARQHAGDPALDDIHRHEATRVARFFLYPPPPSGTGQILRRLSALDPGWPGRLLMDLSGAAARRLRR
jgi:glycosyltransferase involved in cell wall biosynthesis